MVPSLALLRETQCSLSAVEVLPVMSVLVKLCTLYSGLHCIARNFLIYNDAFWFGFSVVSFKVDVSGYIYSSPSRKSYLKKKVLFGELLY